MRHLSKFGVAGLVLALCWPAAALRASAGEEKGSLERAKEGARAAASATGDYLHEKRVEVEKTLKERLRELGQKIDGLESKLGEVGEDAKAKWKDVDSDLKAKRRATQEKLNELGEKTGNAWEGAKKGAENALDDLKSAYEKAKSRLR